jgi:hypothetical protein
MVFDVFLPVLLGAEVQNLSLILYLIVADFFVHRYVADRTISHLFFLPLTL